jgi:hypothetical protein
MQDLIRFAYQNNFHTVYLRFLSEIRRMAIASNDERCIISIPPSLDISTLGQIVLKLIF